MIASPLPWAVSLSLGLQITAAVLALRLMRVTGRYRAWLLVVASLSFMALRRVLVLGASLMPGADDIQASLPEELVALATSALMAAGIYLMRPLFEDLKRSREKYRLVVDNASEAIFIAQDGVIKFPNPKTLELTSYSQEELRRLPFLSLVHPQDQEFVRHLHQRVLSGQAASDDRAFRVIAKTGQTLWLSASGVPILWEGRPAALSFVRDMSEHKHMEQQLLHAQKMEAIGRLAGGVAHDFNNLLMVIKGHGQLALGQVNGNHPLRARLDKIMQAGERGASLTRQLMSVSQLKPLEQGILDLNRLVSGMGEMFRPLIPENVGLAMRLGQDLWPVRGEPGQVEQVVMNLVVNALDAMPQGGELAIETAHQDISGRQPGQVMELKPGPYAMIAVSDSGCGMDLATLGHIFEPFYTTKETGKGTGLGLSVVYGIVKQSGGGIAVQSQPGRGTTFRVYLPRAEEQPLAVPAPKPQARPGRGWETVLLVEDEEEVRSLLAESLRCLSQVNVSP
ncbi:MAG: PAS domain S-box protein [Desulfarculus sp.]|nr:PAS domain S-box protein [Desulfarculus sp.]